MCGARRVRGASRCVQRRELLLLRLGEEGDRPEQRAEDGGHEEPRGIEAVEREVERDLLAELAAHLAQERVAARRDERVDAARAAEQLGIPVRVVQREHRLDDAAALRLLLQRLEAGAALRGGRAQDVVEQLDPPRRAHLERRRRLRLRRRLLLLLLLLLRVARKVVQPADAHDAHRRLRRRAPRGDRRAAPVLAHRVADALLLQPPLDEEPL